MPEPVSRAPSISFASAPPVVDLVPPPHPPDIIADDAIPDIHAPDLSPAKPPPNVPAGSLLDAILHNPTQPCLPSSPFEFPCDPTTTSTSKSLSTTPGPLILQIAELPDFPLVMDSVTRVVGYPHVFGLPSDSSSYVQVRRMVTLLINGGANICLTGDLDLLVDVVEIPPLPILAAVNAEDSTLDVSCTRWGYLPLTLSDGSTHWQLFFIAKSRLRPSSPPRKFSHLAMSLPHGCRLASRTTAWARFILTAMTAWLQCVWILTVRTVYTIA